ncbi:hypothetical protein RFI_05602 [Reticulomyxa filosa]|uniref:Mitochondrial substrate carrier family protein n=1 Tax=Reticulomyxa filosa TaxID=46433 RepID=X6P052_RETFI|nr:hypothetical protein RFI_05602 [Reticulomyxa filosa]|eukprot:ETO31518.1 hypothetical protein RFI_05602 [Reticulomyxa filosa]
MDRQVEKNETIAQIKDAIGGVLAGLISKVVEYPFDTVKVLYQSNNITLQQSNLVQFLRHTVKEQGMWRFFHGLPAPLAGACVENLLIFWLYGATQRFLKKIRHSQNPDHQNEELTLFEVGLAGAVSGVGTGLWLTPVELVKCRMQMPELKGQYRNTWHCLMSIIREGQPRLFTGLMPTLGREVPGAVVYFIGYRAIQRTLCQLSGYSSASATVPSNGNSDFINSNRSSANDNNNNDNNNNNNNNINNFNNNDSNNNATNASKNTVALPAWITLTSGGGAGVCFWLSIYPIDLAKTRKQVYASEVNLSVYSILKHRWQKYGFRKGLYSGFGVTIPRAILSNAIIFGTYEYSRILFDSQQYFFCCCLWAQEFFLFIAGFAVLFFVVMLFSKRKNVL